MTTVCRFLSVVFLLYLHVSASWEGSASSLKTNELLVESAERLSKLFDDVEQMKDGIAFIADQLSNGNYKGFNDNKGQPPRLDGARVTIAQIDDKEVEIRVDHSWENLQSGKWIVGEIYLLPEDRYPQSWQTGSISIFLPLEHTKSFEDFPGPAVSLFVELGEDFYRFDFDIPAALNSKNKTFETGTAYGQLREDLTLFPIGVTPADSISYTPGDKFTITLKPNSTDILDGSLHFYSVSPDPDESVAVSNPIAGPMQPPNSPFSFPNPTEPMLQVDSSFLTTGGILYATLMYESKGEIVRRYIVMKTISLHPQNVNSPIPEGRVAISGEPYANQTIRVGVENGQVSCEAFGNPRPYLEIRLNGRVIENVSAEWTYSIGTMLTVYDVPAQQLVDGPVTCYAENSGDDAEMAINVEYEITELPKLNKVRRLEGDKIIEATCAFKGNPAPTITFYKNYADNSYVLSQDSDAIEINSFQDGYISQATLLVDTTKELNVWEVVCVGESGGQRTLTYLGFNM